MSKAPSFVVDWFEQNSAQPNKIPCESKSILAHTNKKRFACNGMRVCTGKEYTEYIHTKNRMMCSLTVISIAFASWSSHLHHTFGLVCEYIRTKQICSVFAIIYFNADPIRFPNVSDNVWAGRLGVVLQYIYIHFIHFMAIESICYSWVSLNIYFD